MLFIKMAGHLIGSLLVGAMILIKPNTTPIIVASEAKIPKLEFKPETVEILPKLAACESGNRIDVKVLDLNGEYSYSKFQFQLKTFYEFGVKYGLISPETKLVEVENLIYDPQLQTEIAGRMIDDGLLERHWTVCASKINGRNKIDKKIMDEEKDLEQEEGEGVEDEVETPIEEERVAGPAIGGIE